MSDDSYVKKGRVRHVRHPLSAISHQRMSHQMERRGPRPDPAQTIVVCECGWRGKIADLVNPRGGPSQFGIKLGPGFPVCPECCKGELTKENDCG